MDDSPISALDQKLIVSGMAHWLARKAEGTARGPLPIEFMHVRFKEGLGITWDEGHTSITTRDAGGSITLKELDESNAELENG
jgi:hypothetical protein